MMVMMTYPATWQLELRVTAPDLDPDAVIARCRDPRPAPRHPPAAQSSLHNN